MFKWAPFVMVRICLIFIAGIISAIYQPSLFPLKALILLILFLVGAYFLFYFLLRNTQYLKIVSGAIGLLTLFFLGSALVVLNTGSRKPTHLFYVDHKIDYYEGEISSALEERTNSWRVLVEVGKVKTPSGWKEASGNVQLYISKNSSAPNVAYGDRVLVKGLPEEVRPPANPEEFNFKQYLRYRNIYHQQFIKAGDFKIVAHTSHKGFSYYSYKIRAWASGVINQFVTGERERAIASALVLGVTDGIDNDLLGAYAASGALHVLSVSGLHVGAIYFIIMFLVKPVSRYAWSNWILAGVTLILLWAYAFVTGLSPSVLRAVMMFSFIVMAKPLGWKTNIYNTLAASAFLLLLYNPFLVMSVGFQLSYLAVVGILYLHRPLYNLLNPSSWLLDKVWEMTCVSIAAQVATFALGLLYFHQFPVYFLFSNLLVIPLSTFVLVVGILLLVVSVIPTFALAVGSCLQVLIKLLNASVFWVESLPFSLMDGVYITALQCWLLMGLVAFIILLFVFRSFRFLIFALVCAISFSIIQWHHFFKEVNQDQLVVYKIPAHSAIELVSTGQSFFLADSTLVHDTSKIHFHIHPNRVRLGVTNIHQNEIGFLHKGSGFEFFVWKKVKFLWIKNRHATLPINIAADYTFVSNDATYLLPALNQSILGTIILDGSCKRNTTLSLKNFNQTPFIKKLYVCL
jgi:competence protein ComEC